MMCPRCNGPTCVLESRVDGSFVRRRRQCGTGRDAAKGCGLRFTTCELPAGSSADVKIRLTTRGLEAEVQKKR